MTVLFYLPVCIRHLPFLYRVRESEGEAEITLLGRRGAEYFHAAVTTVSPDNGKSLGTASLSDRWCTKTVLKRYRKTGLWVILVSALLPGC